MTDFLCESNMAFNPDISATDYHIERKDIDFLRARGMPESGLAHSIQAVENVLEIAHRIDAELDMELVGRVALLLL